MSSLAETVAQSDNEPDQRFGTAGIKPMARPSLIARLFMGVVALVERLNLRHSKVGNPPIYDNAVFPWAQRDRAEWRAIRAELDRVLMRKDDLPGFHELSTDVADHQPGPRLEDLPALPATASARRPISRSARRPGASARRFPA